jgi:hypothetical protein
VDSLGGHSEACPNISLLAALQKTRRNSGFANGLEQARGAERSDISGVGGNVETDAHVALRAQVINFIRHNAVEQFGKAGRVRKIREMHEEFRVALVPVGE